MPVMSDPRAPIGTAPSAARATVDAGPRRTRTYTPDSPLREPAVFGRRLVADMLASRELAWRLFVRNVSARYRQSVFGVLWAFLPIVANTSLWLFLNKQRIVDVGTPGDVPYGVYVMVGVTLWQSFTEAVVTPLNAITRSAGMLTKISFPPEALLLAGCGELLFDLVLRLMPVAVLVVLSGVAPQTGWLLFPVATVVLLSLGLCLGLVMMPAGVLYEDVGRAVAIAMQFGMYASPIVYAPPEGGWAGVVLDLNPVTPAVMTARQCLSGAELTYLPGVFAVGVVSAAGLLCGWVLYRVSLPHLIARMG